MAELLRFECNRTAWVAVQGLAPATAVKLQLQSTGPVAVAIGPPALGEENGWNLNPLSPEFSVENLEGETVYIKSLRDNDKDDVVVAVLTGDGLGGGGPIG